MEINLNELRDWNDGARRTLDREREKMMERVELLDGLAQAMEAVDEIVAENESMKTEIEGLQSQLQAEKEQRTKAEMQLSEMSKLSAGVAKKASQEEVLKALRVFVNKSKRKKVEKRIAVKEMVLELANANGVLLPEDLSAAIDSLDDEQVEARVVNVQGNYNDIHDNDSINRI
jgi:predicted transcriptional regulator